MKRSLEKKRSAIRRPAPLDDRESIPVNAAAIDMGSSWCQPPTSWKTLRRNCGSCAQGFTVTAAEQQYWYETLRIPVIVGICYCPTCRKGHRAQRRIASRLAELSPQVESKAADDKSLREFVFLIAEGSTRRVWTRYRDEQLILSGSKILLKGCEAIHRLLRSSRPQHDLLPILSHFHQRLGNDRRVARIAGEIATITQNKPTVAKRIETIQEWLASPAKRKPKHIIDLL